MISKHPVSCPLNSSYHILTKSLGPFLSSSASLLKKECNDARWPKQGSLPPTLANEVHREPRRDGTGKRRITHVLLALICPVAIGFEAAATALGLSVCTASPAVPSIRPAWHFLTRCRVSAGAVLVNRAGASCSMFLLAQYKLQQSAY